MANPFQQKVRVRKLIYTGLILGLFTASLVHRKFVVEPRAEELQLRETSRGEVELTSSAVRLTLTGSRGLAVTMLWAAALKEQDRHKWNEVELLVSSITKLQPYFITPWLFQSWNLAFNVAVENDKPRDKYYYVSRGLQLLAEGERRNQGKVNADGKPRFPGNPDMRHSLGFTYQLKIGNSDEKHAMQCLLDLSCIDPVQREPGRFASSGQEVNLTEFEKFCRKYPRLVRRLREDLDYNTPRLIVGYLKDNYVLPARFSYELKLYSGDSKLEPAPRQFPIVPPRERGDASYPDADSRDFTTEALDVFLISRTWFRYSQLPLPPPYTDVGEIDLKYNPVKHRLPRHMTTMIFRGIPARAQGYIAERLEEEGWFDQDGWLIREWFDAKGADEDVAPVGTEPKYQAGRAWAAAYQAYRDFGLENGLYFSDQDHDRLEKQAQAFRKTYATQPGERTVLRPDQRVGEIGESYKAHQILAWSDHYRRLTNYDEHLHEAEAESDLRAVEAKKLFFYANQLRRSGELPRALVHFEKAVPQWLNVLLQYPKFAASPNVQEETYEQELHYLRLLQKERWSFLLPCAISVAQLATPHLSLDALLASEKSGISYIRSFRGPLDTLAVFQTPHARELKHTLRLWSQAGLPFPPAVLPGQENLMLTSAAFLVQPRPGTNWTYLISPDTVRLVRDRVGLNRRLQ